LLAETNQDTTEKSVPKRRSIGKTIAAVFLFGSMIIIGIALGVGLYIFNSLQPMTVGEPKNIEIPQGLGSSQIAEILETEGIIRDAFLFKMVLRFEQEGSAFQAGQYAMHPGMTNQEIIVKLNSGDVIQEKMDRFTVPEGWTIVQMANKLPENLNPEVFIELADQPELFSFKYLDSLPQTDSLKYSLEGYLFPETYEFKQDSTEQDVIQRMLLELESKLDKLPADWQETMASRELDFHHLLTIASLIEREVIAEHERPMVAGIIYNRLDINMMLQIDATVQYLLEKQKEKLLYADLEVDSPYNTYKVTGLPPGPIASPSLSSIEAALYPEPSKYLFYVTKKDGTNEHLFAETYNEHLRNIEQSKKTAEIN
jgi:UPF0755 protein